MTNPWLAFFLAMISAFAGTSNEENAAPAVEGPLVLIDRHPPPPAPPIDEIRLVWTGATDATW